MPLLETGCSGSLSPRSAQATLESCIAWGRLARRSNDKAALARLARTLGERGPVIDGLEDVVHDLSAMRALCVAGYGKEAEGWLRRAVGRGYTQLAWIQDDPELAPVHEAARRATTAAPLSGGADGSP